MKIIIIIIISTQINIFAQRMAHDDFPHLYRPYYININKGVNLHPLKIKNRNETYKAKLNVFELNFRQGLPKKFYNLLNFNYKFSLLNFNDNKTNKNLLSIYQFGIFWDPTYETRDFFFITHFGVLYSHANLTNQNIHNNTYGFEFMGDIGLSLKWNKIINKPKSSFKNVRSQYYKLNIYLRYAFNPTSYSFIETKNISIFSIGLGLGIPSKNKYTP